jgi:hypothetical protein
VAPFANAEHLLRARDWLLVLDGAVGEPARIAALTHDCERAFPGGPQWSPDGSPDDHAYRDAHARRSADIVEDWLVTQGAGTPLVAGVVELVLLHEWGGTPEADLVQAADSLSFLEVNVDLFLRWQVEGRCTPERAVAQFRWMAGRISVERARRLAAPLLEAAESRLLA